MATTLSKRVKAMLKEQYDALLFDEDVICTQHASVNALLAWCDEEYIEPGRWLDIKQSRYRFTRAGIEKVHTAYQNIMGEDIFADFSNDSHQTAAHKSTDEKLGQVKPTHHLVLAAITHKSVLDSFSQCYFSTEQINIELDIRALSLERFQRLVVVENRDSFNDWVKFHVNTFLPDSFVIYRGDKHHSIACKRLLNTWRVEKPRCPMIYFGDCDLAGLRLAISGQYTHLLLPEWSVLQNKGISKHYTNEQQKYLPNLHRDCPENWKRLLKWMAEERQALRQQWMYDTDLNLY